MLNYMANIKPDALDASVSEIAAKLEADVFLVSSGISERCGNSFIEIIRGIPKKRANAVLILTTNGGSADAAYQMARCVKKHYKKLMLFVFGYCKSAGTLVAVGADEIVMSEFGQFGPLDVQLADKNEMFGQTAALDVSQSLATLSDSAFKFFTEHFFNLGPGQGISTKTAVDIAKTLTLGIVEPIASQIDPLLLGRVDRSMKIAEAYGIRLNPNFKNIKRLIAEYPSHEFVIDFMEAKTLFSSVREPDSKEAELEQILRQFQCVPYPKNDLIRLLSKNLKDPVETPEIPQNGHENQDIIPGKPEPKPEASGKSHHSRTASLS
jgi:hypothetical protein